MVTQLNTFNSHGSNAVRITILTLLLAVSYSSTALAQTHDSSPDDVWAESDIVAWYKMDEGSGSVLRDAAGSNDGSILNTQYLSYADLSLFGQSWGTSLGFQSSTYADLGGTAFDYVHQTGVFTVVGHFQIANVDDIGPLSLRLSPRRIAGFASISMPSGYALF